jgi:hypothetical protein
MPTINAINTIIKLITLNEATIGNEENITEAKIEYKENNIIKKIILKNFLSFKYLCL